MLIIIDIYVFVIWCIIIYLVEKYYLLEYEDTPFYKRKDLDFASILEDEITKTKYRTLDNAVRSMDYSDLEPYVYTDAENFSYRIDRNNVDVDTENVELASEQLKYQILTTEMSHEFGRFNTVTKS